MKHSTTTIKLATPIRAEGRFYIGMALVAIAITIADFGPTAFDPENRRGTITLAVLGHVVVFSAWLLLFLTQTILIQKRRIAIHQQLGYTGAVLAVLMVVSGFMTAIAMAQRGYDLSGDLLQTNGDALELLLFQIGDLMSFSILICLAVWYRNRSDVHKRFMLFATIGALLPASLAHIIGHSPYLREINVPIILIPLVMLLFASAVHDRLTRGHIHPVSLWVAVVLFIWANLRATVIGPSDAWHNFAAWLIR